LSPRAIGARPVCQAKEHLAPKKAQELRELRDL